jgi:hypothetical protein
MCAVYRLAFQGWSKADAIDEMVHGGFGFHADWQNLVEFLDALDVAALKKQAGIGARGTDGDRASTRETRSSAN